MINLRKSSDRAFFDHGVLKTYHTFSFGSYYDRDFMGFRTLRVINEDLVAPDAGFPKHSHDNMEILTYVVSGELVHQDSLGNKESLRAGEIQLMHAGSGISHSEFNPSSTDSVHFLQIWIEPNQQDVTPSYRQMAPKVKKNEWTLIVSNDGRENSLIIHQDVSVYLLDLEGAIERKIERYGWLQLIQGELLINGLAVNRGDGLSLDPDTALKIQAKSPSKILLFELA